MSRDRICSRGHDVSGHNKIEMPNGYSKCRLCVNQNERERTARKRKPKIELSEDVRFLLENPDSLPNWDGIKEWLLKTFGPTVKSQENVTAK